MKADFGFVRMVVVAAIGWGVLPAQQRTSLVGPPIFEFQSQGGAYGHARRMNFVQGTSSSPMSGCVSIVASPSLNLPPGGLDGGGTIGPFNFMPPANMNGCDLPSQSGSTHYNRLMMNKQTRMSVNAGESAMDGQTQAFGTTGYVHSEATLLDVGSDNSGIVSGGALYFQDGLLAPGGANGQSTWVFDVSGLGSGDGTGVNACVWSDDGIPACTSWQPDSAQAVSTQLSIDAAIGSSGRYTIAMYAYTLNETVNVTSFAQIGFASMLVPNIPAATNVDPSSQVGTDSVVRQQNLAGNNVGFYTTLSNTTTGFESDPSGNFQPIEDPSDNAGYTIASGINDGGTIVGNFLESANGANSYHGFLLSNGSFSTYDLQASGSTEVYSINNHGDFVGNWGSAGGASGGFTQGFLQPGSGGAPTTFSIPGATNVFAEGVNNLDDVVGNWTDANNTTHGFVMSAGGAPVPFDFPGAVFTGPISITDNGTVNGYFSDTSGTHGFVGPVGELIRYDLPGALQTAPRAMNNGGVAAGTYQDSSFVQHGFTVQLCARDVSSAVSVAGGAIVFNAASGEFSQQITVTNTSTQSIAGPVLIVFNGLPAAVVLDNGGLVSTCMSAGAPYLTAVPAGGSLQPGQPATVTANFANFAAGSIGYTASVLAGAQLP